MFKIAGIKNEKEFYKKFPTEKAFMAKHGKTLKAQVGITTGFNLNELMSIPDYNTGIGMVNDSNLQAKFPGLGPTPFQQKNSNMLANMQSATDASNLGNSAGFMDNIGGAAGLANSGMDIANGLFAIEGQKNAVDSSLQGRKVSDVSLMAAKTEDVDARRLMTEQSERNYNQRMRAVNGEELFPINGVGTNILSSKNGSTVRAQYGYTPFNANPSAMSIGAATSGLARQVMNNDAGSQIGGGIGKIGGTALGGPIGGMVGEFAGKLIGGTIDRSDEKIKKNNAFTERNMMQMGNIAMAGGIHRANNSFMQNGGTMMQSGGEVTPAWGGGISPISYNPYTKGGETNMINGNTHAKGGVGLHYNNAENGSTGMTKIEAEGSEPIMDTEQGMTIFGKLLINEKTARMIGDPSSKGRKFRTYIADQAKKEDKINKRLSSVEKQELLYEGTKVGTLESKTKDLIKMGNDMKLKSIAEHKERAAVAQESLNIVAEETGIPVEKLAGNANKLEAYLKRKSKTNHAKNGKTMYAKNGKTLYAETGITTTSNSTTTVPITTFKSKKEALANGFEEKDGQLVKLINPGTEGREASRKLIKSGVQGTAGTFDASGIQLKSTGITDNEVWRTNKDGVQQKYKTKEDYIAAADAWRESQRNKLISVEEQKFTEGIKATDDVYKNIAAIKGTDPEYAYANVKNDPFNAIPYANMLMPLLRGTDAEDLNANQLYGEMFALSNNQLEPVQGQSYRPELDVPYDISMQDQLNRNTSVFRGAQRMSQGNPEQLAMLQAQEYEANQPVYAEQFRQNQAMKDRVYSGNRATLNDAQLRNIQLNDQQYVRQAQARSNTKEANQLALNSMSDKYSRNQLEQRTLQTYENLYNYRFGKDFRTDNLNNLVDFQGRIANAGQNFSPTPMSFAEIDQQRRMVNVGQNFSNTPMTSEEIAEQRRVAAGGTSATPMTAAQFAEQRRIANAFR